MSTMNEKLRILLANNDWTQKKLAEVMHVSPDTVQKWVKGSNHMSVDTIKEICKIFYVSYDEMLDDNFDLPEYYVVDEYLPYSMYRLPPEKRDSEHTLIYAYLADEGILHRFKNCVGDDCSAIYRAHQEVWWHYREFEPKMIRDWNRAHGNDR